MFTSVSLGQTEVYHMSRINSSSEWLFHESRTELIWCWASLGSIWFYLVWRFLNLMGTADCHASSYSSLWTFRASVIAWMDATLGYLRKWEIFDGNRMQILGESTAIFQQFYLSLVLTQRRARFAGHFMKTVVQTISTISTISGTWSQTTYIFR